MRMLVGYEGTTPAGHYVVTNGISMKHLSVPVFAQGKTDKPVAFASALERDGRELWMEIKLLPQYMLVVDLKRYELLMELHNLESEKQKNGKLLIRQGNVGSLKLVKKRFA